MHKVWGRGAPGGRGLALYCGCCSKRRVVRWGAHARGAYCSLHFLAPRGWRDPFYGKRGPAKINLRRQRRHRWRHQWRHAAVLMKMGGGGTTRPVPRHAAARSGTDKNGRWHRTPCGGLYPYRMEGNQSSIEICTFLYLGACFPEHLQPARASSKFRRAPSQASSS